jgi:hypothetical protein
MITTDEQARLLELTKKADRTEEETAEMKSLLARLRAPAAPTEGEDD